MDAGVILVGVGLIAFIGCIVWLIVRSLNWDSKIPPIIGMLLCVVMVVGGASTMGGTGDSTNTKAERKNQENQNTVEETRKETGEEGQEESEKTPESKDQQLNTAGDLGDYHVEIKGAFLADDYEGNPAIVVTYAWTNNSDETKSSMSAIRAKAFQDGVQLETAILMRVEGYEAGSSLTEIRPGTTIDIQCAYVLTSETSIVEFELKELISLSKDIVAADFDPTSLS